MIVLLEGPDCAGKTTLAKTLFKDWQYYHHGAFPTPDDAYKVYNDLLDELGETTDPVCIDRMHISEHIYGYVYWNSWACDTVFKELDNRAKELDIVVVNCLPPKSTVLNTWRSRLESELIQDEFVIERIYETYAVLDRFTSLPIVTYDYTDKAYNEKYPLLDRIQEA